jgi:hypothetical protein
MSGANYPVRFKLAWQTYRVGDVITPNGLLRDWLMARGYVEKVEANTVKQPMTQRVRGVVTRAVAR